MLLANNVGSFEKYDVIFVGYPIWCGDTPMAVMTFLEGNNFNGKKVIPFCTYDSSGPGGSFSHVGKAASGAKLLEGFGVSAHDLSGANKKVSDWINKLGIVN